MTVYGLKEAAERIGVSYWRVHRAVSKHQVSFIPIGKAGRVLTEQQLRELRSFLKQRQKT